MRLSHISWNLAGLVVPLGVAVIAVPHLIEQLGQERFGLLTLVWGLIGYAGALDLGIGRALTQKVAKLRGEVNLSAIPDVLMTAGRITLLTGLVGSLFIVIVALTGGEAWINIKNVPLAEVRNTMLLMAIVLPAQAMSATYRGMNEAFLNFKGISLLRVGLGLINFGGPYVVSFFTTQLPWLVSTLVISRLFALFIFRYFAHLCLQHITKKQRKGAYSTVIAKSLFSFGGWVTISSIVSPVLVQADRFMIASVLSATVVTSYVLPYEVVVQSLVLVGAVSSVMFPGLSQLIQEKPNQWNSYFNKWLLRVAGMMMFICITLGMLLPVLLPLWIKNNLNPVSIIVGQILCIGVFANAIGSMFYALLHAKGRADVTAKLHLIELPLFITALFFSLKQFGIEGAAWAWVGRMIFDAITLIWFTRSIRA